jgi:Sulfotransferase domain
VLPNFLIIGAAKAGTTSLYNYVKSHPQAFMSKKKELSFFCNEFNWRRGPSWYESQFDGAAGAIAIGEASPRYTVHPLFSGVPGRIATLMPTARLIYLVREPIKRMQSQYLDSVLHGLETRPIQQALEAEPFYLTSSRYGLQLDQYLEHFRRDQILVIRTEDMKSDRERVVSRVFEFLEIDSTWRAPIMQEEFLKTSSRRTPRRPFRKLWHSRLPRRVAPLLPNSMRERLRAAASKTVTVGSAEISPTLRHHLEEQLRDDVKRLYEFLDERFDGWGIA